MSSNTDRGKRNQKACTTCRQVKLRCDSNVRFPAPCTRCLKKNLQCRTDPDFKRTRTRNRLDEVTSQLNAIQKSLADQSQDRATSVPASSTLALSPGLESTVAKNEELGFYQYRSSDDFSGLLPAIDHVSLHPDHVNDLFLHFESYYHRHCPILDTSMSISSLYQSSPILFWTIIMVSSRWHPTFYSRYDIFLEPYRNLLGRVMINQIFSLETVQAITILCFWPLAVPRQVEDPSWNYCGLITNAAQKLGLNKPQRTSSDLISRIKRKTWIAIVQANCCHAWTSGMTISSGVLNSIGPPSYESCTAVEKQFFVKADILRKLARYSSMIVNFKPDMDSLSYVEGLCADLDLATELAGDASFPDIDIVVLGAQLCLYALQLDQGKKIPSIALDMRHPVTNPDRFTSRRDCMNMAYMTAAKFVHRFSEMVEQNSQLAGEDDIAIQRYLPKVYFGFLLLSMAIIFRTKLLYKSSAKSLPSSPDTHVSQVYQILTGWSREPMDEPGRAARVLRVIIGADSEGKLNLQESNDEGRPGVAFLDEVIKTAKEIRERGGIDVEVPPSEGQLGLSTGLLSMTADTNNNIEPARDPSLDWNLPWGLDVLSTEEYNFDINGVYNFN